MTDRDLCGLALGVATSATQIEGGCRSTNWYDWSQSGHILDGSSPAVACDHWNRVDEDVALLEALGIRYYRMGLEWARLEPAHGEFDPDAFAHYRRELTTLREHGIAPLVTLHHFSNPRWFQEMGAFEHPEARSIFHEYVARVIAGLGDLVDEWITINEPNVYATEGYLLGRFPPGARSLPRTIRNFQVLAACHIDAYGQLKAANPSCLVGVANHLRPFRPLSRRNPMHRVTATVSAYLFQDALTEAMCSGRFRLPLRAPAGVRPGRYFDFLGLNYYSVTRIAMTPYEGLAGEPVSDLGWKIEPAGIVEMATWLQRRFGPAPIWVTESGTCDNTDSFRARYLWDHLAAIADSGLDIQRYYHWCLTDNWEWCEGEAARFGIVHTNFETQERTVKASGRFYADVIKAGRLTDELHATYVAGQEYPRVDRSRKH